MGRARHRSDTVPAPRARLRHSSLASMPHAELRNSRGGRIMQSSPTEHPCSIPRLRHMPALDGLRGVAVLGVLLFHAGWLDGGFLGVDLFFSLSGYLITALLL